VSEPLLFEFLSRAEWKMCFALIWVSDSADYKGAYSLDSESYRTPGSPAGKAEFWEESFRRAIRYLSFEHGYEFEAVRPHRDGRIDGKRPITPENKLYAVTLADGGMPHLLSALRDAAAHLNARCPQVDTEPLQAAAADIELSLQQVKINPEQEALRERFRESVFGSLGLARGQEVLH
jgi:hypothetical protein